MMEQERDKRLLSRSQQAIKKTIIFVIISELSLGGIISRTMKIRATRGRGSINNLKVYHIPKLITIIHKIRWLSSLTSINSMFQAAFPPAAAAHPTLYLLQRHISLSPQKVRKNLNRVWIKKRLKTLKKGRFFPHLQDSQDSILAK